MPSSNDVRNDKNWRSSMRDVFIPVGRNHFNDWVLVPAPPVHSIGRYCVNVDRSVELGQEKAKRYCPPPHEDINFDLNEGFEDWKDWTDSNSEKLDIFLKWLCKEAAGRCLTEAVRGANVVSGRGLLRRIAATPGMQRFTYWRFVAQKKNGIVFMCDDDEENNNPMIRDDRSEYHGLKFEQLVTCNGNDTEPDLSAPLKSLEQFRNVCTYELEVVGKKRLTILLTGEIDALDGDDNIVEIKLAKLNEAEDCLLSHVKCINAWLQCTFSGIQNLVIGFKDEQGFVKKVKHIQKDELLSGICRTDQIVPDMNLCFLQSVLTQVIETLQDDMSCVVEFRPGDRGAFLRIVSDRPSILSEEFRRAFNIE